jgi:hypothetical protein
MEIVLKITIIVSLLIKIGMHMHLDSRHKRFSGPGPVNMLPIEYLFLYSATVEEEFKREKRLCNVAYAVALVTIVFSLFYQRLT